METTPTPPAPPVTPQPPQGQTQVQDATAAAPATTTASAEGVGEQVATFKSDLHQAAENARNEFWQISATARMDVHKLIADLEALHSISLAGLKKVLGV